ncbi:MAG: C39 family peptidase [Patescibacteria group bacterium]
MKKITIGALFLGIAVVAGISLFNTDIFKSEAEIDLPLGADVSETIEKDSESEIPGFFMTDIPFISQAPLLDWSWPFKTSCEETSLLMAHKYLTGEAITPETSQAEILAIVDFEKENYTISSGSAAAQIARLARDYFKFDAEVRYDITLDDIKREMVAGNLVLIPTAGRELQNPYFKSPGPIYHMVIMKGYTPTGFIVNEPGTRYGADYVYSNEILEQAIRDVTMKDWDVPIAVTNRTAMVVINVNK